MIAVAVCQTDTEVAKIVKVNVVDSDLDREMLGRLSYERAHLRTLNDEAATSKEYRLSEAFNARVEDTDETIDFPLHWLTDGQPHEFCAELGFDYDSLFRGSAAQRMALRSQMLNTVLHEYQVNEPPERKFDLFVSHASEDKQDFVRPLVDILKGLEIKVWYDESELELGESLRRSIDRGIAQSNYGLVVLSPAFFRKDWTQHELDGLTAMQVNGNSVILPIWLNIGHAELLQYSATLADKVAIDATKMSINVIALEIARIVRGR